jgi:hypothetical protein
MAGVAGDECADDWLDEADLMCAVAPAPRRRKVAAPKAAADPADAPLHAAPAVPARAASRVVGQKEKPRRFVSPSLKVFAERCGAEPASGPRERTFIRGGGSGRQRCGVGGDGGLVPDVPLGTRVGPFELTMPIPDKQLQMLRDLQYEFRDVEKLRGLADMLSEERISLKLYDWFVSRFTQDHRTLREVRLQDGSSAILDVNSAFRSDRWAVRKRHWDFFGKRAKVAFEVDGVQHMVSVSQLNAYLFVHRFGVKELALKVYDELVAHYEQGKVEAEAAAIRAAKEAAREAGLPEDAPLKRKRGRRRKPRDLPPPIDPVMLSEGSVTTRLSLQDGPAVEDGGGDQN